MRALYLQGPGSIDGKGKSFLISISSTPVVRPTRLIVQLAPVLFLRVKEARM
jgi:hypothetical protein